MIFSGRRVALCGRWNRESMRGGLGARRWKAFGIGKGVDGDLYSCDCNQLRLSRLWRARRATQNAALHEAVPDAWYSPAVGPEAQRDARALSAVPTP